MSDLFCCLADICFSCVLLSVNVDLGSSNIDYAAIEQVVELMNVP